MLGVCPRDLCLQRLQWSVLWLAHMATACSIVCARIRVAEGAFRLARGKQVGSPWHGWQSLSACLPIDKSSVLAPILYS